MPAPHGRICTFSKLSYFGPIQYGFNPPPDPTRCFGFCGPQRTLNFFACLRIGAYDRLLQYLEHKRGIDRLNGQITKLAVGVGREHVPPLLPVLLVPPTAFVCSDVAFAARAKGDSFRGREGLRALCGVAFLDWV